MRLHMHPASPSCIAVLAAAAELDMPLEIEHIDLMAGENRNAAFLAINPNGLVPVLEDGDFVLWETVAILQYMAAKGRGQSLLPRDERDRANVTRWQSWSVAHWQPALQVFIFQRLFKRLRGLGDADEAAIAAAQPRLNSYAKVLDDELAGRSWICGDHPTLADLSLGAYLVYQEPAQIPLATFSHLTAWWTRLSSRPAWFRAQSTMPKFVAAS